MLVLCLLLAAPEQARAPRDLSRYLAIAAAYRSADHEAALREILGWRLHEIRDAAERLRRSADRIRMKSETPSEIDFRTVEAAILLHAEAGLVSLKANSPVEADVHLGTATDLLEWSHRVAEDRRPQRESGRPGTGAPALDERLVRRDFYLAMAAATIAAGRPLWAHEFAERGRRLAPSDPELLMWGACAAEGVAMDLEFEHRDHQADEWRETAEKLFRDTLAIDPRRTEARLRLGQLLLRERRTIEAEPVLHQALDGSRDERERYLALLFLGRLSERRNRPRDAIDFYRRALEAQPDAQAARLALAMALEKQAGPAAGRPLVLASLGASRRLGRATDPWWQYPFGPPAEAASALSRLWDRTAER